MKTFPGCHRKRNISEVWEGAPMCLSEQREEQTLGCRTTPGGPCLHLSTSCWTWRSRWGLGQAAGLASSGAGWVILLTPVLSVLNLQRLSLLLLNFAFFITNMPKRCLCDWLLSEEPAGCPGDGGTGPTAPLWGHTSTPVCASRAVLLLAPRKVERGVCGPRQGPSGTPRCEEQGQDRACREGRLGAGRPGWSQGWAGTGWQGLGQVVVQVPRAWPGTHPKTWGTCWALPTWVLSLRVYDVATDHRH